MKIQVHSIREKSKDHWVIDFDVCGKREVMEVGFDDRVEGYREIRVVSELDYTPEEAEIIRLVNYVRSGGSFDFPVEFEGATPPPPDALANSTQAVTLPDVWLESIDLKEPHRYRLNLRSDECAGTYDIKLLRDGSVRVYSFPKPWNFSEYYRDLENIARKVDKGESVVLPCKLRLPEGWYQPKD